MEGGGFAMQAQVKRAQKRLSVLLRTLYSICRLNPTYQLVRRLHEAGPRCGASIHPSLNAGLLNSLRGDMERLLARRGGDGDEEGEEEVEVSRAYYG